VGAAQDAEPDDLHVLLQRDGGDGIGTLADAGVDDLEPGVAQPPCDELGAAVVTIEAGLGDQHARNARRPS
jgi:hypothetical protein